MNEKLSEALMIAEPGAWVPAALFRRFLGVAYLHNSDGAQSVTVQLRKATSAAGAGAVNFGTAGTTTEPGSSPSANRTIYAFQDGDAQFLGADGGGVQYTHVSMVITDSVSPDQSKGLLICGDARFSTDALAHYVPATHN